MSLCIGCDDGDQLLGYADADFAECRESRKSHSGFILMLGGPISWVCCRQSCVALSSTEAEYVATDGGVQGGHQASEAIAVPATLEERTVAAQCGSNTE